MASAPIEFLLTEALERKAQSDRPAALALLSELLRHEPDHVPALRLIADLQLAVNPVAAANAAHRIVQSHPDDFAALELLARALSAVGRHDEALRGFQRVAAAWFDKPHAHTNLSISLLRAGDPHAAVAAARRAIDLDPARPESYAALGHAYNILHQSNAAVEAFHTALKLSLNFPDALFGVARAYRQLGRPSTAIRALLRAIELSPNTATYRTDLATLYRECGNATAARAELRQAVALSGEVSAAYGNLLLDMQYDVEVDEAEAAAEANRWGLRQIASVRPVTHLPNRDLDPDRTLRVGYVSADFYCHPVGWLGSAPIINHDRTAVTAFLYANQTSSDWLTDKLRKSVDAWVPVMGLDDDSLAARIAADRIDILVDLAGHTAGNRLSVFAMRPAPIQVTWLGYAATTGLPTMDYILLDEHHLCPHTQDFMIENVVRLPQVRFCYTGPDYAGDVGKPPSSATDGVVTFGSFNNSAKINDAVIALWARVLATVQHSRLLLKWRSLGDPLLQTRIRGAFLSHGIDGERIQFEGAMAHTDMLRRYCHVDVALDPFPFSGGLTTCEALWMGVPVVTLVGARPFARQTHAILHAIGRPEWSARTPEQYVEIAARLARDPIELGRTRLALRQQMLSSPLCDAVSFARDLERVYRKLWLDYLAEN